MANLKIIIVGGGISGLTLANCLQHAGIDFVLLEGRSEIGIHVGAGVGIEPNGDRILDQLGVRGDLEHDMTPYWDMAFWNPLGKLMYETDYPTIFAKK
jgi:2-polyprenyl-6-methoxyphenol hydroxylase-like FAD-dependent oxidoreductase